MKYKLIAMLFAASMTVFSAGTVSAEDSYDEVFFEDFFDECDDYDYQMALEEDLSKDLTKEDFWSYYDNGTYKVGCTEATVCVMDQDEQILAEFRDIPYCAVGAFQPGANLFVVKSTTGKLAVYDLDKMELVNKIDFGLPYAQDDGFGFTSDGKYFYDLERVEDEFSPQLTIYKTEDFSVEKTLFTEDSEFDLGNLEFFEDHCYLTGFYRGDLEITYFAAELIDDELQKITLLDWDDADKINVRKRWERTGCTDVYRDSFVYMDYDFDEDITIKDYVESAEEQFTMESFKKYVEEENKLLIHVEPVIQRFLNQVESYEFVTDAEGSEYATQVAFFPAETITNVTYSSFQVDFTEEGEFLLADKKELFSIDTLTPDQIFVAELEFMEFMPTHCIEFTDESGAEHCYLLAESGRDGMPYLSKYEG